MLLRTSPPIGVGDSLSCSTFQLRELSWGKKMTVVFFFELQAKSNTVEQAPAAAAALEMEAGSAEDDQVGKFQIPLVDINFF